MDINSIEYMVIHGLINPVYLLDHMKVFQELYQMLRVYSSGVRFTLIKVKYSCGYSEYMWNNLSFLGHIF